MFGDNTPGGRRQTKVAGDEDVIDLTDDLTASEKAIDLTGSDGEDETEEDEDLKLAIALSLQDQEENALVEGSTNVTSVAASSSSTSGTKAAHTAALRPGVHQDSVSTVSDAGLASLDRKQMEAERIARLKRKREPGIELRQISPPPLRRAALPQTPAASSSTIPGDSSTRPHLQYPNGKILLTSVNKAQPRSSSLTDLLRPADAKAPLKSALLSTYTVDFDWLLPHFDTRRVSFVFVLHARDNGHKMQLSEDFAGIPNVRLAFPHIGGNVRCMHSKIMILFYNQHLKHQESGHVPERCRIVIPSANLVPWDYGVGGVMENALFVIDLPPQGADSTSPDQSENTFKQRLVQLLRAMNTPPDVIRRLDTFDFAAAATHGFVHTIGGTHMLSQSLIRSDPGPLGINLQQKSSRPDSAVVPPDAARTGILSLASMIRSLGLNACLSDGSYPPQLDYVASSLGSLKESFLANLYWAACGSTEKLLPKYSNEGTSVRDKTIDDSLAGVTIHTTELAQRVNIYYPSEGTVENSTGGSQAAGTIFFQPKWSDVAKNEFLKTSLRDCVAIRDDGVLMHSKVLFLRFAAAKVLSEREMPQPDRQQQQLSHKSDQSHSQTVSKHHPTVKKYAGWIYIGSANVSESAWGSISMDNKSKQYKVSCRNWESGVIVPVPLKPEHEGKKLHELSLQEVFDNVMPVPMHYPGVNMSKSGHKPWGSSS